MKASSSLCCALSIVACSALASDAASAESMNTSCYAQKHGIAAHKTLPFGTRLHLRNPRNGRTADVVIHDRGPFIPGRNLDISCSLARELGIFESGVAHLTVTRAR